MEIGLQARQTYDEVALQDTSRPLDFPAANVTRAFRGSVLAIHPSTGQRDILNDVVYNEEEKLVAYSPLRVLQAAIYGKVQLYIALKVHTGPAADESARMLDLEPGDPRAPIVWEVIEGSYRAIKMLELAKIDRMKGKLLEDPVKEVAAMQLIGNGHRHVLGAIEVLQDDTYLYSVMPYANGGDLFSYVSEGVSEDRGLDEPVARYLFKQLLNGLNFLQSKGICHRDISLENVLVHNENCLVIDFGMCLRIPYSDRRDPSKVTTVENGLIRRLMKPMGVCGKHNYMSPEVLSNTTDFDGFSIDLWGAGVILYIMLTGFPPYDQASLVDGRFEGIVSGNLVGQLRDWGIILSDEAGDLLQKMFKHHPRDRLTLAQVMEHPWVTNPHVEVPRNMVRNAE
mmetsp:Transcript_8805/g.12512  ORF Transcript_8805/g.12512 Transcript_8805/m.12512 type:complete len:397 (+) Transcript_8805:67-1257(+)